LCQGTFAFFSVAQAAYGQQCSHCSNGTIVAFAAAMHTASIVRTSLLSLVATGAACVALSIEHAAAACTAPAPPEGYLQDITMNQTAIADTTSPLACKPQTFIGSCGPNAFYSRLQGVLAVQLRVGPTPKPGDESFYIAKFSAARKFTLFGANGNVVEVAATSGSGNAIFTKLGSKICVTTDPLPVDGGAPDAGNDAGGSASEYCVPVTVTDLTVTAAQLKNNTDQRDACLAANADADAGADGGTAASDGGPVDQGMLTPNDGLSAGCGCNTVPAARTSWLAFIPVGAVLAALRRRRSARH
jgi:hypothetical protein